MRPQWVDLTIVVRGFLMGAADVVPGVSGGTVALIVGIYDRLLAAVSHFDVALMQLLARKQWRAAAHHIDLRFLVALTSGIAIGVVSLAGLMHHLLTHHRSITFSAFFGLILASGLLVGRMCKPKSNTAAVQVLIIGAVAMSAAYWFVSRSELASGSGLTYTFFCGAIAICAMILPGVSGSYLLVLLGMYEPITGLIKRLPRGEVAAADFLTLALFACGCLVGLLSFSKLLKWLLSNAWTPTMAALCGFMIGSLYKIWPFQVVDESLLADPTTTDIKEQLAASSPYLPKSLDGETLTCLGVAAAATVFVLVCDAIARRGGADERLNRPVST